MIAGAEVVDNLMVRTNCSQNDVSETRTNCSQILPTNESQIRSLVSLEPEQQRLAWQEAVEQVGGKVPPARVVKDVVQRIREKTPVPNPFKKGEVCSILVKENPDLRGLGSCWAIVVEVREFGCQVQTFKGEVSVKIENLKPMNYSEQERKEMLSICDRLQRLREVGGEEEIVMANLTFFGKIKRPFLTPKEEGLLSYLEEECGVNQSS